MARVLLSLGSLALETGGPAVMFEGMTRELAALGNDLIVATQTGENTRAVDMPASAVSKNFDSGWPWAYSPSNELRHFLTTEAVGTDIVHTFGLWRALNRYSWAGARKSGTPFVVSPQGMLSRSALRRQRVPKMAFWWLWQRRALRDAVCVHATSELEARDVRRMLGRKTPIAVVPNGIDVPVLSGDSGGNSSPGIEHGLESRRYFLYLGRIHPFKGLAELVAGWSRSSAPDRGFALVIAGPCESRFEEWFKRLLRGARKPESLKYVGETKGEEKASFLAHARALILPSLSENFGIVVGEALVQQTPAIANFGAPWSLLVEEGCGWWIPYGEESLTAAIEEASKRPREEIEEMGRRGRLAVERRLSWPAIGTKMNEMYRWLSDGTPLPFWFTMGETP